MSCGLGLEFDKLDCITPTCDSSLLLLLDKESNLLNKLSLQPIRQCFITTSIHVLLLAEEYISSAYTQTGIIAISDLNLGILQSHSNYPLVAICQ